MEKLILSVQNKTIVFFIALIFIFNINLFAGLLDNSYIEPYVVDGGLGFHIEKKAGYPKPDDHEIWGGYWSQASSVRYFKYIIHYYAEYTLGAYRTIKVRIGMAECDTINDDIYYDSASDDYEFDRIYVPPLSTRDFYIGSNGIFTTLTDAIIPFEKAIDVSGNDDGLADLDWHPHIELSDSTSDSVSFVNYSWDKCNVINFPMEYYPPPNKVICDSPQNEQTYLEPGWPPVNVDLRWHKPPGDPYGYTYKIYLGKSLPLITADYKGETNSNSFTVNSLDYDTKYYWIVVSSSSYSGNTTGDVWWFKTHYGPPGKPELFWPTNEEVDLDTTIDFHWIAAAGTNVSYHFYLWEDWQSQPEVPDLVFDTHYQRSGLKAGTKYWWKVEAKNDQGVTPCDSNWGFTTYSNTCNLTMSVNPKDSGTTTPDIGSRTVNKGESIDITMSENAGYLFTNWTASPSSNVTFSASTDKYPNRVTLSGDATISANFSTKVQLNSITISGPPTVDESSGAQYTCTANFSDGSTSDVTSSSSTSWSQNSSYASITPNGGYLTTLSVSSDQPCQISASYSGKSATYDVTIKDNALPNSPPVVSGVSGHQRAGTKLVDISYTVTDADGDQMSIAVYVSYIDGNGTVISVPVNTLSGDGANGVKVASGPHSLVWDAGADWPGQFSDRFSVSVTADDGKNYMVIDLSGGMDTTSYPVSYLDALPNPIPDDYRTIKLAMRKIPAGTFTMGSPEMEVGRRDSEVQHQVTLTKDFYIGVFEVTQKQWERVMGYWPSYFNNTSVRDVRPVEEVTYNDIRGSSAGASWPANSSVDATSFMGKLRQKTGMETLDLPTEAQWEYACRAGTSSALNNGTNLSSTGEDANMDLLGRYWCNGGAGYSQSCGLENGTAKVGSYLKNAWGLYDMHGNVSEWCMDYSNLEDDYPRTPVSDPKGLVSGSHRTLRSGAWGTDGYAEYCRSASRGTCNPNICRSWNIGFRLAMLMTTGTVPSVLFTVDTSVNAVPLTAIDAITGTAHLGSLLTAGALTPAGATASYQWKIAATVDGSYADIPGATSSTYTPVAGDVSKFIKVAATGTGSYSGTVTSTATVAVTAAVSPLTAIGVITGTAQVGSLLTAGALTPAGATASYQWKICATADGTYANIAGATSNTYTPVAGDVSKFIKVSATGTGSYSGTVTSMATAAVTAAVTPLTAIGVITGTAQVGSLLTAGALTPAGATASYQWKICATVDGTYANIAGATSNTYTPVVGDVSKFIKVVATGTGSYSGTVTSTATAAVAAAPAGLVAYYPLDGNAKDESGNGHDGIIHGNPSLTTDRFETANRAYSFDGTDDYIDLGNIVSNSPLNFTQCLWIKASTQTNTNYPEFSILSKRNKISQSWPSLCVGSNANNGKPMVRVDAPNYVSPSCWIVGNTNIFDNNWHFVCGVKSENTYRIYVDGKIRNKKTDSKPISSDGNLQLMYHGAWNIYLKGAVDDVRIFDRALTSQEIYQLFDPDSNIITASAGANGSISPHGDIPLKNGSSQIFTIAANQNYQIADVLVDGLSVGAVSSYAFTDVVTSHTIAAKFGINSGVAFEMPLPAEFSGAAKITVKGLPPGLQYNTSTRKITGVPTTAGDFSAVISAEGVPTQTIPMNIVSLPAWAYGSFNGYSVDIMGSSFSMSITALGKITGKLALWGKNYVFGAASYEAGGSSTDGFSITVNAKAGKEVLPLTLRVRRSVAPAPQTLGVADGSFEHFDIGTVPVILYRDVWKEADVTPYIGYFTTTLQGNEEYGSGYLTFTVDAAGKVKTAGKLADGTVVSLSGTLILDETNRVFTVIYTYPAVYKGGHLFGLAEFVKPEDDGSVFLRLLDGGSFWWQNCNLQASGDYSGFLRAPVLVGGWYDKLINLRDYYGNGLKVGAIGVLPTLYPGVKNTEFDENNRKVTNIIKVPAEAAWSPGNLALTVTPATGAGTGLTAPKAQTPLKVSGTGEYNYADLENPTGLSISFTRATGIFKGSFNLYYDYISAEDYTVEPVKQTWSHVVKKVSYEGVLTPDREDTTDGIEGQGFYLWPSKGSYTNAQEKLIYYNYNRSYDFIIQAGQ